MGDKRYTLYHEGWQAECEVMLTPNLRCRVVLAERTRKRVEKAIREHIKADHPEHWGRRIPLDTEPPEESE